MSVREIPMDQWSEFLDQFSRGHRAWRVVVIMNIERQHRHTRPGIVVIMGASAGVGKRLPERYGARGSCAGLIARGRHGLEAAWLEIEQSGERYREDTMDLEMLNERTG